MCFFVLIAVPASSEAALLAAKRGLVRWPGVEKTMKTLAAGWLGVWTRPSGVRVYNFNGDKCACGWYADPKAEIRPAQTEEATKKRIKKYQQRGWSSAKIERALDASRAGSARQAAPVASTSSIEIEVAGLARCVGELAVLPIWCSLKKTTVSSSASVVTADALVQGEHFLALGEFIRAR